MSPEEIKEKLTKANLKATQQRIVVFKEMLESELHPSAEMVYENLKTSYPSLSLATVYKTLDSLAESGLIKKVATPKGTMRYDAETNEHHHIYCSDTDEIIDFQDEELNSILKTYLERKEIKNLKINDIRLHINGKKIDPEDKVDIN